MAAALAAAAPTASHDRIHGRIPTMSIVDELRRRARRRLVGAIVLALAAAVFVPMLLESDPKPLGEDVSVKIPPVDDGKFVNRLNEKSKTDAKAPPKARSPKAEPKAEAPKPRRSRPKPDAEGRSAEGRVAESRRAEPKAEAAEASEPRRKPSRRSRAPRRSAHERAAPAPQPSLPAPRRREPRLAGEFSVQLSAFSDDKGANSLANKLKEGGYPAYTRAGEHEHGHAVARARRPVSRRAKRAVRRATS